MPGSEPHFSATMTPVFEELTGFTEAKWNSHLQGLSQFSHRSAIGALQSPPELEKCQKLTKKIESFADSDMIRVMQPIEALPIEQRGQYEPQCRAGCHHCCYQWVCCTIPEAIFCYEGLKARRAPSEIAKLREELDAYIVELKARQGRLQIACPLLSDGMCSAYEHRPLACRTTASLSAEQCGKAREDPENTTVPYVAPFMFIGNALKKGLVGGLRDSKLDSYEVVLQIALAILIDEPEASAKFLAGQDVFASARVAS
jgi:Fe-S-cluster containining protein